MLTLEAAVDHLNVSFPSLDFVKEHFLSTPNLCGPAKRPRQAPRTRSRGNTTSAAPATESHARSTSYAGGSGLLRREEQAKGAGRPWTMTETDLWGERKDEAAMPRSRSSCSMDQVELKAEDKLEVMCRIFWAAVALLESDYEYEFHVSAGQGSGLSAACSSKPHMPPAGCSAPPEQTAASHRAGPAGLQGPAGPCAASDGLALLPGPHAAPDEGLYARGAL